MTPMWAVEYSIWWWNIIAAAALKSAVVLLAAAWLARRMQQRGPAVRHVVWQGGLIAAAALPLLSSVAPVWSVLPPWFDARHLMGGAGLSAGEATARLTLGGVMQPLAASAAVVWSLVALMLGAKSLLALSSLRVLARRAAVVDEGPIMQLLQRLSREMGIGRRVRVLLSRDRTSPMTWGVLRPILLLPSEANAWKSRRLEIVLRHELAHIRRLDCLTQLAAQAAAILYWFNPLVWYANEQMRLEREAACDDLVLASGVKASEYAENLISLSHRASDGPLAAAAAMADANQLEQRLFAILDPRRLRVGVSGGQVAFAAAALALAVAPLCMIGPRDRASAPLAKKAIDAPAAIGGLPRLAGSPEPRGGSESPRIEAAPESRSPRDWASPYVMAEAGQATSAERVPWMVLGGDAGDPIWKMLAKSSRWDHRLADESEGIARKGPTPPAAPLPEAKPEIPSAPMDPMDTQNNRVSQAAPRVQNLETADGHPAAL